VTSTGYEADFQDGAAYERFMGRWSRLAGQLFVDWLQIPPQRAWLDVGCGTGAFTQVILATCDPKAVVAIDPSEKHLNYARLLVQDRRVEFRVGDATAIEANDHAFDVCAAAFVLNFIPQQRQALAEMRRVVRPGGTVAAYVWDFAGRRSISQHLWNAIAAISPDAEVVRRNALQADDSHVDALTRLFRSEKLADIETRSLDILATFESLDEYWRSNTDFASAAGLYCRTLAGEQVDALRRKLREILPANDKGQVLFPARAWAIRGSVPQRRH
jgi:ubiquinone/menaquinone biosynthesis C-methylase UbiE